MSFLSFSKNFPFGGVDQFLSTLELFSNTYLSTVNQIHSVDKIKNNVIIRKNAYAVKIKI